MSDEGKVFLGLGAIGFLVCSGIWNSCEESAEAEKQAKVQAEVNRIEQERLNEKLAAKAKRQTERSAFEMQQIPELKELYKEVQDQIQAEEKGLQSLKDALVDLNRDPMADEDYLKRQKHIELLKTELEKIKKSMDDLWIDFVKMKTAPDKEKNEMLKRHKKQVDVIASEVKDVLQEVKENGL